MVESKLVELVVAGSNPVGHPIPFTSGRIPTLWFSGLGYFRHPANTAALHPQPGPTAWKI